MIHMIRVRFMNGCNGVPRACEWKRVELFVFGSWSSSSSCSATVLYFVKAVARQPNPFGNVQQA